MLSFIEIENTVLHWRYYLAKMNPCVVYVGRPCERYRQGHHVKILQLQFAILHSNIYIVLFYLLLYAIITHVHMINYAIKHRHAYDRWKNIPNVMILKDQDNYKIHCLRIIHLFECDYNFFLGLKWKDASHKAQKEKTIDE